MNVFQPADLDMFFEKFVPDQVGHRPKLLSIAGGQSFLCTCSRRYLWPYSHQCIRTGHLNASEHNAIQLTEASLDFELLMGLLGHEQEVLLYQTGIDISNPTLSGTSDVSLFSNSPAQAVHISRR